MDHPSKPLPVSVALGSTPALREPLLDGGRLFWLEQRPHEGGRTTLMLRVGDRDEPVELTPGPWNLRSRVHEYGGGAYAVSGTAVVFVHDGDRCLWMLELPQNPRSDALPAPRRLTDQDNPAATAAVGGGLIDPQRRCWLGVAEEGGQDRLVRVPLGGGPVQTIHTAADFCGYPALSPSGTHLAWVEWQQPFMPWERSQLWLGALDPEGLLTAPRPISGSDAGAARGVSVFQPLWTDDGDLVVANDRSGWWNLERLVEAEQLGTGELNGEERRELPWQPLLPMEAEFAMPQWVFGMRTCAWDGARLWALACRSGVWELGAINLDTELNSSPEGRWAPLPLAFNDLAAVHAESGRLVMLAGSPLEGQGLLELRTEEVNPTEPTIRHTAVAPSPLAADAISTPEPIWFPGDQGQPTHAWFYPPLSGASPRSPLLVKGHSGPTGMARTSLNLTTQFWTSRGWGVVDVNYGGSTGFGRTYRERLNGRWGVGDVHDCAAAAEAVVALGRADPERIAIEGSSAGGFTVLAALCWTDVFRAGACRYGVADPSAMAMDSHRFEARYLDSLIGPWPEARDVYGERSPLQHADRIRRPVILFQGTDDVVVPPEQTERMALALQANGVPVEVHLFEGEGHGFRDRRVQIQVLEATEAFFRRHFRL